MNPILPIMVVQNQHMMPQNAQGPPPPSSVHNTQYMQMQTTPTIGSTLSSNPSYQSSPNQNNGDINANKKTPKEKTPMCQVNEIAKFNKLVPKYTLTGEEGPPHHKSFTVTLELGPGEKFEGTGTSIKKAQHAAAKKAIDGCDTLERPKYKPKRPKQINYDALTPTVKLNGLAMKRGEMANYKMIDRKPIYPSNQYNAQFPDGMPQIYPNSGSSKRGNARLPKLFVVELTVGEKIFHSEGRTRQQAKHQAATQALDYYERNPPQEKIPKPTAASQPQTHTQSQNTSHSHDQPKKSEVSLVYELALKRNLPVHFEKISEEGPPHLKHYSIKLHVGKTPEEAERDGDGGKEGHKNIYFTAEGQAQSKKLARRKAAIIVLDEMKKVIEAEEKEKPQQGKGKGRNKKKSSVIKETEKQSPDVSLHPVSRLAQIQQAAKEREPIYQVISERSVARKKEFVMQCIVNDKSAQGIGPNKKTAKKLAAEAMLAKMGHAPSVTTNDDEAPKEKPSDIKMESVSPLPQSPEKNLTSAIPLVAPTMSTPAACQTAEPQLQYLASLQGFKVQFTDFPKDGQYLSLVSIDTSPPLVAHGQGQTVILAHEEAATQAMKLLMTRGLESK